MRVRFPSPAPLGRCLCGESSGDTRVEPAHARSSVTVAHVRERAIPRGQPIECGDNNAGPAGSANRADMAAEIRSRDPPSSTYEYYPIDVLGIRAALVD